MLPNPKMPLRPTKKWRRCDAEEHNAGNPEIHIVAEPQHRREAVYRP
jgi:hypothetical protein